MLSFSQPELAVFGGTADDDGNGLEESFNEGVGAACEVNLHPVELVLEAAEIAAGNLIAGCAEVAPMSQINPRR